MNRIAICDLPDDAYDVAKDMADGVMPLLQLYTEENVRQWGTPGALGIGAATMIYLLIDLQTAYYETAGIPPTKTAIEDFVGDLTTTINKMMARSAQSANGELN